MLLDLHRPALVLLLAFLFWSTVVGVSQAASAAPTTKQETEVRALRAGSEDRVVFPRPVQVGDKKALRKERKRPTIPELHRKKPPARHLPLGRRTQMQKNPPPMEPVQPKPDLSYHGILEQPQRYTLNRDQRKGAVPIPQAGESDYDHFQELDKNRDGVIDPLERASARLDIDWDLANRQRE